MTNTIFNDIGYLGSLKAEAASAPARPLKRSPLNLRPVYSADDEVDERCSSKIRSHAVDHLETYQSMADQQMAVSLSQQGGIGIARMLVEQMQTKGYVPVLKTLALIFPLLRKSSPRA